MRIGRYSLFEPRNCLLLAPQALQRHRQGGGGARQFGIQRQGLFKRRLSGFVASCRCEGSAVLEQRIRAGRFRSRGHFQRVDRPGQIVLLPQQNPQVHAGAHVGTVGRQRFLE